MDRSVVPNGSVTRTEWIGDRDQTVRSVVPNGSVSATEGMAHRDRRVWYAESKAGVTGAGPIARRAKRDRSPVPKGRVIRSWGTRQGERRGWSWPRSPSTCTPATVAGADDIPSDESRAERLAKLGLMPHARRHEPHLSRH
jgi:hypothetical protein